MMIGERKMVRYRKPGPGEPTDAELIARAQVVGADGKPTADAVAARNALVLRHEAFIWMKTIFACRSIGRNRTMDLAEHYFPVGVMAFIRAVECFRPEFGFTLLTYAGRAIVNRVALERSSDTPVTRARWSSVNSRINNAEKFEAAGKAARLERRDGSIIDPGNLTRHARVASHADAVMEAIDREDRLGIVAMAMTEALDARELEAMRLRFFVGLTLEQTGRRMGVTRERVRQIQRNSIEKIGKWMDRSCVETAV